MNRVLARRLPRYENATPDRIWRHFLNATGTLHATDDTITADLRLRTHHPVLIDADLAEQTTPNPLAGRPHTAIPVPAPLKPQDDYLTENRG